MVFRAGAATDSGRRCTGTSAALTPGPVGQPKVIYGWARVKASTLGCRPRPHSRCSFAASVHGSSRAPVPLPASPTERRLRAAAGCACLSRPMASVEASSTSARPSCCRCSGAAPREGRQDRRRDGRRAAWPRGARPKQEIVDHLANLTRPDAPESADVRRDHVEHRPDPYEQLICTAEQHQQGAVLGGRLPGTKWRPRRPHRWSSLAVRPQQPSPDRLCCRSR